MRLPRPWYCGAKIATAVFFRAREAEVKEPHIKPWQLLWAYLDLDQFNHWHISEQLMMGFQA